MNSLINSPGTDLLQLVLTRVEEIRMNQLMVRIHMLMVKILMLMLVNQLEENLTVM